MAADVDAQIKERKDELLQQELDKFLTNAYFLKDKPSKGKTWMSYALK
jgi:hypothetical protein